MRNRQFIKGTKAKDILAVKTFVMFSIAILILQACFQTNIYAGNTKVFRVSDGKTISYEQMIDDLQKVDVVFVGETHDRESHHRLQFDIIKTLNTLSTHIAVGFEMFTYESQNDLDRWVAGMLPLEDFIKVYYKNWNSPWSLYQNLLLYVRDYKIPAIGLNVPAEISRKVSTSGFSSLTKKELEKLPPEVGCAVGEKYMKFIRRAYAIHGHSGKQFLYFCEAQLLWDQVMARNLLEFLKKNPSKTIIALTGNGHAWKGGIPEQARTLSEKTSYRVILPEIPGYIDQKSITVEDADYILLQ
jgi:uncharacterized iron-regulated protein